MPTTLAELAQRVDGLLVGDGATLISGAATLEEAGKGDITMVDSVERSGFLAGSRAAAVLLPQGGRETELPAIVVKDVHRAFTELIIFFRPLRRERRSGISPAAFVSPAASCGEDVDIHPGSWVGEDVQIGRGTTIHSGVQVMAGCTIGESVTLMPGVVLYENSVVGSHVTIHARAVIGAYGFGYQFVNGRHERSAQLGYVEIGDHVEIGAGTTIDRGTYGRTVIGAGTKIDNLVMVAHNCRLGRHNIICSQVGIAGSTTTGDYVVMAGQVGVCDHVHIGKGAVLGAKAGVSNDVPEGVRMIGIPATPEREQKLKQAAWAKLPAMRKQLRILWRDRSNMGSSDRRPNDPAAA